MAVLTESKIKKLLRTTELKETKTLVLELGTVITPSAKDYLKDITIEYVKTPKSAKTRNQEGNLPINQTFEIEASGRHIHLNREAIDLLFGEGYELHPVKYLSQTGEFAAEERVSIEGPKATIDNVIILGPERKDCQVEVSLTDARLLGIDAPVRLSGNIEGSPGITIKNKSKSIVLDKGVIVAKRHIHVKDTDAGRLGVKDQDKVSIQVFSERPLIFEDVIVRINPKFETYMHIDYDEANACGHKKGVRGLIVKR